LIKKEKKFITRSDKFIGEKIRKGGGLKGEFHHNTLWCRDFKGGKGKLVKRFQLDREAPQFRGN